MTNDTYALGDEASFGGIVEGSPGTGHYLTTPEVAWVVQELERRNLTRHLSQIFLHDDMADVTESARARSFYSGSRCRYSSFNMLAGQVWRSKSK